MLGVDFVDFGVVVGCVVELFGVGEGICLGDFYCYFWCDLDLGDDFVGLVVFL